MKIKAILIDPFTRYVEEVQFERGDWRSINKWIENGDSPFTSVRVNSDGDTMYLDDEGLFKDNQSFFWWHGANQPFAGKAIIIGCDRLGRDRACKITRDEVIESIVGWSGEQQSY